MLVVVQIVALLNFFICKRGNLSVNLLVTKASSKRTFPLQIKLINKQAIYAKTYSVQVRDNIITMEPLGQRPKMSVYFETH